MAGLIIIFIYTFFTLYLTLFPFGPLTISQHLSNLSNFSGNIHFLFVESSINLSKSDLVTNFISFFILGLTGGIFLSGKKVGHKTFFNFLFFTLYSLALCTVIEILQRNIPGRVTSLSDIMIDTASASIGFLFAVFLKLSGLIDIMETYCTRQYKENPLKLIWILIGGSILACSIYPFDFDITLDSYFVPLKRFDKSSYLLGTPITPFFFTYGAIFFSWGALCVLSSTKKNQPFFWQILKKVFISGFIIFLSEFAQTYFLSHTPSRLHIEIAVFWLMAGVTLFAFLEIRNRKKYAVLSSSGSHNFPYMLFFGISLTILIIVAEGLYPFNFVATKPFVKQKLAAITYFPFADYIANLEFKNIAAAFQLAFLYLLLGLQLTLFVKKRMPSLRFIPVFSSFFAVSISFFIECAQTLIPKRATSVSDIMIAFSAALTGGIIATVIFAKKEEI